MPPAYLAPLGNQQALQHARPCMRLQVQLSDYSLKKSAKFRSAATPEKTSDISGERALAVMKAIASGSSSQGEETWSVLPPSTLV